jgi:hypothetical protein
VKSYEEYLKLIKEGLIKTYNIEKYSDSLEIELNSIGIDYEIEITSKYIYNLIIKNSNKLDNDILIYVLNINKNLFGYYPSYIWVINTNNQQNSFIFDEKYLNNKYKEIKIRFEAKYDDGLYSNDIETPKISYHLSPEIYKNNILDNGLYPKSKNRKTNYDERIYLFYNLSDYKEILEGLKINDKFNNIKRNYCLFKINLNDKIISHKDPNYDKGFYVYDNISPKNIKLIKNNL